MHWLVDAAGRQHATLELQHAQLKQQFGMLEERFSAQESRWGMEKKMWTEKMEASQMELTELRKHYEQRLQHESRRAAEQLESLYGEFQMRAGELNRVVDQAHAQRRHHQALEDQRDGERLVREQVERERDAITLELSACREAVRAGRVEYRVLAAAGEMASKELRGLVEQVGVFCLFFLIHWILIKVMAMIIRCGCG